MYKYDYVSLTINELCDKIDHNLIDLDIDYQRKFVWKPDQKIAMIQSIVSGIYPGILTTAYDSTKKSDICIDGKQRMTTMYQYTQNEFGYLYEGKIVYYSKKSKSMLNTRIMSRGEKLIFSNTKVHMIRYIDILYDDQIAIFNSVQNGSPLTKGELIAANFIDGVCCRKFKDFCNANYKKISRYVSNKRDAHNKFMCELLFMYYHPHSTKFPTPKEISEYYKTITSAKIDKFIKTYQSAINFIFSDNLLNHDSFTKSVVQNMSNLMMLVIFMKLSYYEDGITAETYESTRLSVITFVQCITQGKANGKYETIHRRIKSTFDTLCALFDEKIEDDNNVSSDESDNASYETSESSEEQSVLNIPAPLFTMNKRPSIKLKTD